MKIRINTALLMTLLLIGCMQIVTGCTDTTDKQDGIELTAWFHTGRPEERAVMEDQVKRFNAAQHKFDVNLTFIPEGDYNTQVQAAAAADNLPDLLDLDGPFLYNYAWKNHLIPLDDLIPTTLKNKLLPSLIAQGTYNNRLYSIGTFDSGLGLYVNLQKLEMINARIPSSPSRAWTVEEFETILRNLAARDEDGQVLDLRLDYRGEWYTYAFSPVLQSAGGDLINRNTYETADGVLNSPQSIAALTSLQQWLVNGYVDPNIDTNAFTSGRVALSWCGHWEYTRYKQALGDDLALVPLPDFGKGSKTGMGSWNWAVTRKCKHPDLAIKFLRFLLKPEEILAMTKANGAVPATDEAISHSRLYQEGGPLHLFVEQLKTSAVPRPQTPAYPVITSAFQEAFLSIRNKGDVRTALDKAVRIIDQDIQDNRGYPEIP